MNGFQLEHAHYIALSWGLVAVVMLILILWIVTTHNRLKRQLEAMEAQGFDVRRSDGGLPADPSK